MIIQKSYTFLVTLHDRLGFWAVGELDRLFLAAEGCGAGGSQGGSSRGDGGVASASARCSYLNSLLLCCVVIIWKKRKGRNDI